MIGLDYIVKVYNGTFKKLAEKLEVTPPTIMGWLSKKRPIPKAKLELLVKLFNIKEEYFVRELNEVEKIEIQLEYLRRISKKESYQMPDFISDEDGNEHEVLKWVDPYEHERKLLNQELEIEMLVLNLRSSLYSEVYDYPWNIPVLKIMRHVSSILSDTSPAIPELEQQQDRQLEALGLLVYYLDSVKKEDGQFCRGQNKMEDDLYDFMVKYDLLKSR